MKKLLVFVLLAYVSLSSSFASSWHYASVGNGEAYYYFDRDTIERNPDKSVLIWVKTVQTMKPDTDGSWSTSFRWKVSCAKRKIQTQMWSTYDQDAKFIKSNSTPSKEEEVILDSIGEAALKMVCDPSFPNDTSGRVYFKLVNNDPFLSTRNLVEFNKSKIDNAPK